ncbi:MAG: hypothetical protein ACKVZH_29380 [Blastocatellia bacterium]
MTHIPQIEVGSIMTREERIHSWKNRVRELPKQSQDELLFEFYRVLENSVPDSENNVPSGMEHCRPPHQRTTKHALAEVCATAYGGGTFIALEVSENLEGFPLSFWIIKVLSSERCAAQQIFPEEEQLKRLRQHDVLLLNYGCKDEAWFWQRGNEALWIATEFLLILPEQETVKVIQERNTTWKEFCGELPKGQAGESLFIFLRVNDGWMIDPTPRESFTFDPGVPLFLRAMPKTLAKVCARTYGGGSFVAVEISESRDGHALSYWIIRVKSRDLYASKQVAFDDEKLKAMRQPIYGLQLNTWQSLDQRKPFDQVPDRRYAYFEQWLTEASFAAHELKSLSIPEKRKRKGSRKVTRGRPTDPGLDYVRKELEEGASPKQLKSKLIEKGLASNADEAEKMVKNGSRKNQLERQKKKNKQN